MRNLPALLRAAGAALFLSLCSCAAAPVRVPALRPAEIDMAPYRTVAVGELGGTTDRLLSERLEEALVASNRFHVLEPKQTVATLRELHLAAADLADPEQAAKVGKALEASALVYGDVEENYHEIPSEERSKDKDNQFVMSKVFGEMTVRAHFKVVDLKTGRLIAAKTYEERRDDTSRAIDRAPDPIDQKQLARSARAAVIERFLKAIVPYQEYVTADFAKDSALPQLESGIAFAEHGDWKKAEESFSAAVTQAEKGPKADRGLLAKAYWDLGLAYEYAGEYDKATETVRKAYELSNDKAMRRELDSIDGLKEESRKVAEQTLAPEVARGK